MRKHVIAFGRPDLYSSRSLTLEVKGVTYFNMYVDLLL